MVAQLSHTELERFGVPLPPGTLAWGIRRGPAFATILTACPLGAGDWGSEGFAGAEPSAKDAASLVEGASAGLTKVGGRVWLSFGTLPGFALAGTLIMVEKAPDTRGPVTDPPPPVLAEPARVWGSPVSAPPLGEPGFAILVRECQKGSLDFPEIPHVPDHMTLEPYKGQGTALWRRFIAPGSDDDGEEMGVVVLSAIDASTAHLNFFGLKPAWRGRGLGEALLREAIVLAGQRTLTAAVDSRNSPARALYKKLGFRETGTKTVMWKNLRG
ncbi:MAG: GNAT family N-acetyltransferase [Planctomycetota bacterium]